MKRALLAVLLLGGCGSAGQSGIGDDVAGNWISNLGTCVHGINFVGASYIDAVVCPDANAVTYDLQEETGTFTVGDGRITYSAQQSTCPAAAVRLYYTLYSATPSSLALTYSDGITTFQRNTAAPGGVTATFGCFTAGSFAAGPLTSLN